MTTNQPKRFQAQGKSVLVTGCSSGIGRATALHLARQGFSVFASVRREADAESLRKLQEPNLIPICPLDLTKPEQIPSVMATVAAESERRGQNGLYALVNNAGAGSIAPIELLDLEGFRMELEARLLGTLALVQACLPLLRKAAGRIVWVTTPAIIPTPYVTSIHACDFAVNCIARTLDIELKPWNIPVSMVRCGGIRTRAGMNTLPAIAALLDQAPSDRAALYRPALQAWGREMAAFDQKRTEPEAVAGLIHRALAARTPGRRYAVGHMAGAAGFLESLPQPLADWILKKRF
ncbi:MAG TPA: SDR family NAD(P)-dependent oxidoreductase [Anaerolineales bacterium]|nr:SDR family NAD(P)-dependent oxidoreductase [Anaerolineales bacterium]